MKKITKKTAALTAAMMALTALGSMSVYAENTIIIDTTADPETTAESKNATLFFKTRLEEEISDTSEPSYIGENESDDSSNYVWCIELYQPEDNSGIIGLFANIDLTKDYTVEWNPTTHKYVRKYTGNDTKHVNDLKSIAASTTRIINHSNFSVDWRAEISGTGEVYNTIAENGITYGLAGISSGTMQCQGSDNFNLYPNGIGSLTAEQKQIIYQALVDADALENDVDLCKIVVTFTPSSDPIPFEESGEYDTGNLPE